MSDLNAAQPPHPIHRWSGFSHLLLLTPFSISDIFDSDNQNNNSSDSPMGYSRKDNSIVMDLSTTKLLMSAFAIAFQNTGCNLPIFVPIGVQWRSLFAGYLVTSNMPTLPESTTVTGYISDHWRISAENESDVPETAQFKHDTVGSLACNTELRFNMFQEPFATQEYSHLEGLLKWFRTRLENRSLSSAGGFSQTFG
jgi:hypothetical protein